MVEKLEWLIRKGGYFYRPNCQGYTTEKLEAGRYTEATARAEAAVEPWHMSAIHQDEWPDKPQVADLNATITRLEAENRELREIVSKCCNALPNGAFCSPKASLDFMRAVPDEILLVTTRLVGEAETARAKLEAVEAETLERCAKVARNAHPAPPHIKPLQSYDFAGIFRYATEHGAEIAEAISALKDKDQQNG